MVNGQRSASEGKAHHLHSCSEVRMSITMNDLTISPHGIDMNTLLSEWTWAMPEPLRPVLLTAMGDVFAQVQNG